MPGTSNNELAYELGHSVYSADSQQDYISRRERVNEWIKFKETLGDRELDAAINEYHRGMNKFQYNGIPGAKEK